MQVSDQIRDWVLTLKLPVGKSVRTLDAGQPVKATRTGEETWEFEPDTWGGPVV